MSLVIGDLEIENRLLGDGTNIRASVRVATTANGALATAYENGDTVDGVILATNDRILLKDQSTGAENGVYTVNATGAPTRALDFDTALSAASLFIWVREGTANANSSWICTNAPGSDVIGTDALTFSQYDVTDTLSVTRGGTGATSLASGEILVGGGTGAITASGKTVPTGDIVGLTDVQTLSNKTFTGLEINDTSQDHQYIVGVSELTLDRTITLPLLTGNDTFVFEAHAATLTNKTLTSPIINQILDSNSNEVVILGSVASAVNELTITNAATGTNPSIAATGTDANIDVSLQAKGTGAFNLLGTAATAAELRLYEDTDDGTNYVGLKAGTITSDITFTLPVADGTSGQVIQTNGAGVLSFVTPSASSSIISFNMPIQITASNVAYTNVAYFAWDNSEYAGFSNFKFTFEAVIATRTLDIQLYNITEANVFVEQTGIAASTFNTLTTVSNTPTVDSRLAIRVRRGAGAGASPDIYGVQIQWNT